jgi:pimeloyl-ACP methyl ester carboxylesterase
MIPSAEFSNMGAAVFARYALSPKIRHLSLAKPKLALRAYEIGKGEPILFMHGITLTAACWASLIAKLRSSQSIAIDMPGHGGSDGTDHSKADLRRFYTQMIVGCLDELGTRSAHLVGHSYSAMFALWLALDSPERVRSVVVVGAPSVAFGAHPDLMFRMLSLRGVGPAMLSAPSPLFIYRRMLRSFFRTACNCNHAAGGHPHVLSWDASKRLCRNRLDILARTIPRYDQQAATLRFSRQRTQANP